jgi:hypothetical protein
VALADERSVARAAQDFRTADELRGRIEAAGWRVVDDGTAYTLEPARPPDSSDGERTLYGAVESVPSRLAEPPTSGASVIVVAAPGPTAPAVTLGALAATAPTGTQVLLLAGPDAPTDGPADEVIGTAVPFGAGDALQAALRRTNREIVIVLEPDQVPTGDIVTPTIAALRDPSVAIVGAAGLYSPDLHRYHPLESGDATTVGPGCYGFRRAEVLERGPVDGRLRLPRSVAAWLGLLLRDEGPEAPPRRAAVIDLPLADSGAVAPLAGDHARLARRDGYRIADRFRHHRWLAGHEPPRGRLVGDGADEGQAHDDGDERDHADDA